MPLYWQAADRQAVHGDRAVRPGDALPGLAAGRPRIQPGRPRSRAARRLERDHVRAGRPEGPDDAAELPLPRDQRRTTRSGARSTIRSRSRCCGASRSKPRTATRVLVDATDVLHARRARRGRSRCAQTQQGSYKLDDSRSAIYMPRTKGFPKNTEVEAILTFTTDDDPGRVHPSDDAVAGGGHAARASFVRRAAGPELQAAQARSPRPVVRHRVLRLRLADQRAGREALDFAPSTREEGSDGRRLRAGRSRSSITSTTARPSRSAPRSSKARRGGTRRSRRPASATRFRSRCCPPMPIRWTSATT